MCIITMYYLLYCHPMQRIPVQDTKMMNKVIKLNKHVESVDSVIMNSSWMSDTHPLQIGLERSYALSYNKLHKSLQTSTSFSPFYSSIFMAKTLATRKQAIAQEQSSISHEMIFVCTDNKYCVHTPFFTSHSAQRKNACNYRFLH